jgi:hypothetical protein
MKSRLWCASLALVGILAGACSGQSQTTTDSSTPGGAATGAMQATAAPASVDTMTIMIRAQNGSGESGTATLTRMGSKTRVVIGITGENTTGKQPAHIHKGTCKNLDPIPAYPLHDVVLGKSNSVVDVSLDELVASPMAVNIHESAANIKKYVACGAIH